MRSTESATVFLLFAVAACSGSPSSSEPESHTPAAAQESSSAPGAPESSRAPRAPGSSRSPSAPSYAGEEIRGWPTTSKNPAGVYSWDGSSCAGNSCIVGFIHNGYGSGDVTLHIDRVRGGTYLDDRWTTATVAGQDGRYRRTAAQQEVWLVEIEGTTIAIHLTTRLGTRKSELDEAHAIIDSMATDARNTELGFRLVFTLTTNDWDSG